MSYGDDYDDARAGSVPAQTRTRLPDQPSSQDRRPPSSPGRSMITIVAVVVLLVAAIVFANQARDDDRESAGEGPDGPRAQATAPTGELPVDGATNGIPSGFAQTEQGAQSAAANYAVALGGTGMFNATERDTIVSTISSDQTRDELLESLAAEYGGLNESIGLDAEGAAPEGNTFVNRTLPIGSTTESYSATTAEISVWCAGLFGLAGLDSQSPVRTSWFTMRLTLTWEDSDWKVVTTEQTEGPTPVNGDNRISGAEEIAEAIEEFGGFTYAR
ncbi:hypothetical protein SAMN06297387_1247 [Streptomyces zhaozhouensis]|uniref:DUF8175 domain-containing protein n=1 Tax=Streptomyces zhaozhouensis TaxID=1300267 RepID=A0A286E4X7_9ACTN|nr:hypothetical protein [Streptomyces zhaozhouensis]SOD65924.1 hypothetical protein SAMN06297387_1247 [Streptomyces zhaozhouensis]